MVRALFPTPPSPTTTNLYVGRLSLGTALVAMITATPEEREENVNPDHYLSLSIGYMTVMRTSLVL